MRRPGEEVSRSSGASCPISPVSRIWRISRLITRGRGNWRLMSVLLVSAVVISFWQFRHTEAPLVRRVFSAGNVNDFSWRNRVAAWEGAGRMMRDKPLLGFGWGQAEQVYSKEYRAARLEEAAAIQMNDYLMIGISAGGPALGCLLIYLGLVLLRNAECGVRNKERAVVAGLQTSDLSLPTSTGVAPVPSPDTRHPSLAPICVGGALVLLLGFWFDGGMFKLPTVVVFWVLIELARISPRPVRQGRNSREENLTHEPPEPTPGPSREGNDFAKTSGGAPLLGGAGGGSDRGEGLGLSGAAPRALLNSQPATLNVFTLLLRWIASLAVTLAVALTAVHLITPQLIVSERTLAVARKFLVPPAERVDFDYLAAKPIWANVRLQTLLQHAHLAHYNRTLVNWKLEDEMYREYVLAPEIHSGENPSPRPSPRLGGERESEPATIHSQRSIDLNWRRELWEYFYPRIRRESNPGAAAEMVWRGIQEKIAVTDPAPAATILAMWREGRASAAGRARLEVAALRAVGIPARLTADGQLEFWNGTEWRTMATPGSG
jgi:hypothetical protein